MRDREDRFERQTADERRAAAVAAVAAFAVTRDARLGVELPAMLRRRSADRRPAPAAGRAAPGPPAPPPGAAVVAGNDFIVPVSENIQMPSPRVAPANTPPPACTTTRCSPLHSNVVTVVLTPASVMNSHSSLPFALSSAVSRPSLRPTNSKPPAVTTEPL